MGFNTPGAASSAADLEAQETPKSRPKAEKIDVGKQAIFDIDFFASWPGFWNLLGLQDGTKSAALLAAPGVLNPTAFYACINILHFLPRGGVGHRFGSFLGCCFGFKLGPCWPHFSFLAAFFRSWACLCLISWLLLCFLARLGRLFGVLGRSGVDFGRFWRGLGKVLDAPRLIFRRFLVFACRNLFLFKTSKKPRKNNGFFNVFKNLMVRKS